MCLWVGRIPKIAAARGVVVFERYWVEFGIQEIKAVNFAILRAINGAQN